MKCCFYRIALMDVKTSHFEAVQVWVRKEN